MRVSIFLVLREVLDPDRIAFWWAGHSGPTAPAISPFLHHRGIADRADFRLNGRLMKRVCLGLFFFWSICLGDGLWAADLPPDATAEIPNAARRPVVVTRDPSSPRPVLPGAELPDGLELSVVAAAPLVSHPIMACLDDRGRLFVGDAVGVNWNKAQLEATPPNRVLLLEDTDRDGTFDKSTVFADRMTFPQGGCWLDGSLYVCSPPGLWRLTDRDGDGVAEERQMIVGGFDYTGNAADVHGPFLHPNGRLYWCHGRKGHQVRQLDGSVVHEGLASGIWSCLPDGSDVAWHSLGCGDNPVEVDFAPEGEIIGVQNLYYNQPRGDVIVHWLPGGIYERADQMKAIEGLPRTLETMPVMYNFGHVAVSGCCFARSGRLFPKGPLQFLVTHFNTQRVVRMELTPQGATWKATENECLRLPDSPDVHFTDVLEDGDGSLLVVDTGGWFRIGCPSSLMAKPELAGAIYRVGKKDEPYRFVAKSAVKAMPSDDPVGLVGNMDADPSRRRRVLERVAKELSEAAGPEILQALGQPMDEVLEHSLLHAALTLAAAQKLDLPDALSARGLAVGRLLLLHSRVGDEADRRRNLVEALDFVDSPEETVAQAALAVGMGNPEVMDHWSAAMTGWLQGDDLTAVKVRVLENIVGRNAAADKSRPLLTSMLSHQHPDVRRAAWRILGALKGGAADDAWLTPIGQALETSSPGDLGLVLAAVKALRIDRFASRLQILADQADLPMPLRLKALDAMNGGRPTPASLAFLTEVLTGATASPAARIQAAGMLAAASLDPSQTISLAPALATVGPVELEALVALIRKNKDEGVLTELASALAKNPLIGSKQESFYRTAFADKPVALFEGIVLPALRRANEVNEAKKRRLPFLVEQVAQQGRAGEGRKHFEGGKGTCLACHRIGDTGRAIGPDLSHIGAIRTERDLLESILFPGNTLARDYEAHAIELADGQTAVGVIKSHTAEGLLMVDAAGVEKTLPHESIVSDTVLPISLMPMGLDQTLPEPELLDLVAYLRSLK